VGGVVGDGGRDVKVGVWIDVATGGAGGVSVGSAVGERGVGVALGPGSAVGANVGEATGAARGATEVGLGCVGAQLDRDTARSAANSARLKGFILFMCLSLLF
jgi:hypothetical protein